MQVEYVSALVGNEFQEETVLDTNGCKKLPFLQERVGVSKWLKVYIRPVSIVRRGTYMTEIFEH